MQDFNKIFEELTRPKNAELSLKEFSNWILGISIGLCAFIIAQSKDLINLDNRYFKSLYFIILILSMLNSFISGFNKYLILRRDSILSVKQDMCKKIMDELEKGKIDRKTADADWNRTMSDWLPEFRKIITIRYILNISLILTVFTSLLIGLYIILSISNL